MAPHAPRALHGFAALCRSTGGSKRRARIVSTFFRWHTFLRRFGATTPGDRSEMRCVPERRQRPSAELTGPRWIVNLRRQMLSSEFLRVEGKTCQLSILSEEVLTI